MAKSTVADQEHRGKEVAQEHRGQTIVMCIATRRRRYDPKERREPPQRREREKQPDPNSPFAKLAALKAQLEANAKERH